jgi:hypothetical protein
MHVYSVVCYVFVYFAVSYDRMSSAYSVTQKCKQLQCNARAPAAYLSESYHTKRTLCV